jgi:hypothetical protein
VAGRTLKVGLEAGEQHDVVADEDGRQTEPDWRRADDGLCQRENREPGHDGPAARAQ